MLFGNENVSRERHPTYGELVGVVIAYATFSGPLFGAFISDKGSQRWILHLKFVVPLIKSTISPNGACIVFPAALFLIALLIFGVPNSFPDHIQTSNSRSHYQQRERFDILRRIDYVGAGLLLAASLSFVAVLLKAHIRFP